jgi:hypothetical protein
MAPSTIDPNHVTNFEFADRVGLHHTMASRLRNGERLPSIATFIRTMRAFELDCDQTLEWLDAVGQGAVASGEWMRRNIFAPEPTPLSEAG